MTRWITSCCAENLLRKVYVRHRIVVQQVWFQFLGRKRPEPAAHLPHQRNHSLKRTGHRRQTPTAYLSQWAKKSLSLLIRGQLHHELVTETAIRVETILTGKTISSPSCIPITMKSLSHTRVKGRDGYDMASIRRVALAERQMENAAKTNDDSPSVHSPDPVSSSCGPQI